ncbi:MAG TPA: bifunctional adenosylcobinamide kinase/adenosylcobinamide-phosphate guanylyltransferase [Anaerolineales bacterium]
MGKLTLILGGARSGKSSLAEQMAGESAGSVAYIATAQALDEEMQARIEMHREKRPEDWRTFEIQRDIGMNWREVKFEAQTIILDCLTLLVTNLVMAASPDADHPDETSATKVVEDETDLLLALIRESEAHWILVSNEVGLGLVPPYPVGRLYRDLLGFTNQRIASQADEVYWMLAGIAVPIHQFRKSNLPGPYGR